MKRVYFSNTTSDIVIGDRHSLIINLLQIQVAYVMFDETAISTFGWEGYRPVTPICFFSFLGGCGGLGLGTARHSAEWPFSSVAQFLSHSPIRLC